MFNCIVIPGRAATLVVLLQMKKFGLFLSLIDELCCKKHVFDCGNQRRAWTRKWLMKSDLKIRHFSISAPPVPDLSNMLLLFFFLKKCILCPVPLFYPYCYFVILIQLTIAF